MVRNLHPSKLSSARNKTKSNEFQKNEPKYSHIHHRGQRWRFAAKKKKQGDSPAMPQVCIGKRNQPITQRNETESTSKEIGGVPEIGRRDSDLSEIVDGGVHEKAAVVGNRGRRSGK